MMPLTDCIWDPEPAVSVSVGGPCGGPQKIIVNCAWVIFMRLDRYWNGKRSLPRLICMVGVGVPELGVAGFMSLYHSVGYSCRKLKYLCRLPCAGKLDTAVGAMF